MIAFSQFGPLIPAFLAAHPEHRDGFSADGASHAALRALLRWVIANTDVSADLLPHVYAGLALLADLDAQGR